MSSSLLATSLAFAAFSQTLHPYEAVEPHMGTLFRIKLYAANQEEAQHAFQAAFRRVAALDNTLSDYRPGSELSRLSREAVRHPVTITDDLLRVIDAAQKLSATSDGAFDITLGPLTRLWREARKTGRIPAADAIAEAKARSGYEKLRLDARKHSVELETDGMQLDAGGIAKGDAADQALLVLKECGIRSALVAASGDLAFSDAPPGEVGWKVGVDSLDNARARFTRVLTLANAAVSTSGAEEQHLNANGVHYSHIIDSKTGLGLTDDITVSVVARRGIDADSLATALSVLGKERGLALIDELPDTSALVLTVERGKQQISESSGFHLLRSAP